MSGVCSAWGSEPPRDWWRPVLVIAAYEGTRRVGTPRGGGSQGSSDVWYPFSIRARFPPTGLACSTLSPMMGISGAVIRGVMICGWPYGDYARA